MIANIQPPILDSLVDQRGMATRQLQNWLNAVTQQLSAAGAALVLTSVGPAGGGRDDTSVFQRAIGQLSASGGGVLWVPAGNYHLLTVTIPAGSPAITIMGCGASTVITRGGDLTPGHGMFDVYANNLTFSNLLLDGDVTTSTPLFYNQDFLVDGRNDPMAPSLSNNTLVWAHGPLQNLYFYRTSFRHSSGYAPLIDAASGGISLVTFEYCDWDNCRPNIFGIPGGQPDFGSWGGGLYVNGDGRASNPGRILKHLTVSNCSWNRVMGNCAWSHLYGLEELHEDFRFVGNTFLDCGLDGILIGGVQGGAVTANRFRRIGYVTRTDADRGIPRWLPNLNATALDSSGLVLGVPYTSNSFISTNGGAIDTDSHGQSVVSSNSIIIPQPGEVEYEEDSIAISGINNNGSTSYGYNGNNSGQDPRGAAAMSIVANTFIGLPLGSIRMFATRNSFVNGNTIEAPANSIYPPISMGPVGDGPNQRCYGNKVSGNNIHYGPVSAAPVVFEDNTYSHFLPTESNAVYNNNPITGGGAAFEFQKSPTGGSVVYSEQVWWP